MTQPLMEVVGAKREGIHAGGIRQRYILDDRGRRLIQDIYNGTSESIDELVRLLGVPRWKVKMWGSQMGLTHQERFWTQEDEDYLTRNLHRKSLGDIAKHLGRTKVSVKLKAKRLGVNKCGQEGYTMRGLCLALGCDHHKVERWLEYGWLKGTHRHTERTTGDVWLFVDRDIRNFVMQHPLEVDPRRMDWLWMVDLLAGDNYGGIGSLISIQKDKAK
jgi:hypothetical protein